MSEPKFVVIFNQVAVSDHAEFPFLAGQVVPVSIISETVKGWVTPRPDGTSVATLYRAVALDEVDR